VFAVLLRVLGPVVVLLLLTLFGCGHSGRSGGRQRAGLAALGASRCRVTVPNRSTPPGERPDRGYDGNGALWTALPLDGNVVGIRQELLSHPGASQRVIGEGVFGIVRADGAVAVKFPWWGRRGATDALTITGRRLDRSASPLRVDAPPGSGSPGFWASRIIFPTEGCWSVTGRAQAGTLTFTVHVMKANDARVAAPTCGCPYPTRPWTNLRISRSPFPRPPQVRARPQHHRSLLASLLRASKRASRSALPDARNGRRQAGASRPGVLRDLRFGVARQARGVRCSRTCRRAAR
jgi:hypothetical protein